MIGNALVVAFEGIDNSGKTTLRDHVHDRLIYRGIKSTRIDSVPKGHRSDLAKMLIEGEHGGNEISNALVYASMRANQFQRLEDNKHWGDYDVFLLDRSAWTNRAYLEALGYPTKVVKSLFKLEMALIPVDMVVMVSITEDTYFERWTEHRNGNDPDIEITMRAQDAYHELLHGENVHHVHNDKDSENIDDDLEKRGYQVVNRILTELGKNKT